MARESSTAIRPSPEARHLFGQMVAKADADLHLTMEATLDLSVQRVRAGHRDHIEIHELQQEQWIGQAQDGGWILR